MNSYRHDRRLTRQEETFNISMGFGLHAGWAIEGAVGSLQKVDATYLSPHVNMAARMEAASKQFGVAILMSERFFEVRDLSSTADLFESGKAKNGLHKILYASITII